MDRVPEVQTRALGTSVALTLGGCPVCGCERRLRVTERNQLSVVRCPQCGQRYVWPVPSPEMLAHIYDRSYYEGAEGSLGFKDYAGLAPARHRMFARHLDQIERLVPRGRVLDVGCATGDFLAVARTRGWEALGVDPSPAREQALAAGIPMVGQTIHDAQVEPGSVDLVTFWDVLEHVQNPVADLRRARELLSPQGIVAITVPDSGSAVARLSGDRWFGYKTAGEHLQFFSAATLQKTFGAAGLELMVRRPVAWSCTLGFLVDRAGLYLGPPGRALNRLASRTGLGGLIVDVPQVNQFAIGRGTERWASNVAA